MDISSLLLAITVAMGATVVLLPSSSNMADGHLLLRARHRRILGSSLSTTMEGKISIEVGTVRGARSERLTVCLDCSAGAAPGPGYGNYARPGGPRKFSHTRDGLLRVMLIIVPFSPHALWTTRRRRPAPSVPAHARALSAPVSAADCPEWPNVPVLKLYRQAQRSVLPFLSHVNRHALSTQAVAALMIGINYTGQRGELRGCHNDVENIQKFLISNYNFKSEDMVVLLDLPGKDYRSIPTKDNIARACAWLTANAQPNDSLFFHYSGHGGRTEDLSGDEDDGYDETIYPVDHERAGHIIDDHLHDWLVKPLPPGCRLTAVMDCCHSGSALDLPYIWSTQGKLKEPNVLADVGQGALGAVGSYMRGDLGGVASTLFGSAKKAFTGKKVDEWNRKNKSSPADVRFDRSLVWGMCN